jgi:hypothetical protein
LIVHSVVLLAVTALLLLGMLPLLELSFLLLALHSKLTG